MQRVRQLVQEAVMAWCALLFVLGMLYAIAVNKNDPW
jgi:hypothetical protein